MRVMVRQPPATIEESSLEVSLSHMRSPSLTITGFLNWESIQARPMGGESRHNFAVNLLALAQYLVGSCGYYRVTYRPVTILAPVNQLSVWTSVAGGNEGL